LESLHLKGNRIRSLGSNKPHFRPTLHYVDLSSNEVADWTFVDDLPTVFPGLLELRFSNNPLYGHPGDKDSTRNDDAFMLTIARLKGLTELNFSKISAQERTNAEMFYLSKIGQEMAEVPEDQELSVTSRHKRYSELCTLHDPPNVIRTSTRTLDPNILEARLIKFTFYLPPNTLPSQDEAFAKNKEIPKSFDTYRIKGIVGKELGLRPLSLKLVWETGDIDPVADFEEVDDDEDDSGDEQASKPEKENKWIKREVVLEDNTRPIGNMIDCMVATVRIELL
jgi:hypothetical protein